MWKVVQPDGSSVTNEYWSTGQLKRIYGTRTYPVGYGYDSQGRMTSMTNWTTFASGAGSRVTTWTNDQYRGFLVTKRDANNQVCDNTYTLAGRLATRTWARGSPRILTTYGYDNLERGRTKVLAHIKCLGFEQLRFFRSRRRMVLSAFGKEG